MMVTSVDVRRCSRERQVLRAERVLQEVRQRSLPHGGLTYSESLLVGMLEDLKEDYERLLEEMFPRSSPPQE